MPIRIPWAPDRASRYDWSANRIPELIMAGGQAQAEGHLRSGAIWGRTLGDIGTIAGQAIQQHSEQKKQEKSEKQLAIQDAAFVHLLDKTEGMPDPKSVIRILGPDRGMKVAQGLMAFHEMSQKQGEEALALFPKLITGMDALSEPMRAMLYPRARQQALQTGAFPQDAIPEQYEPEAWSQISAFGKSLTAKAEEDYTLAPGAQRRRGATILAENPPKAAEPPTAGSFEDYMTTTPERRAEIEAARKGYQQSDDRPPVLAYQSKEVLDDGGRPVMANFDARSGAYVNASTGRPIKNPRPVPSAAETQDARKFAQAGPVLSAVSELSEKINTQQGLVAKMAGGAKKLAAQANYDDDVAEYEALVMGFTPLVARALGHTGVLTEQDVQSVRMLFPKPGDSKSLRDRKVARINGIIGQLEGAGGGGVPGAAPATAPSPRAQDNPLAVTAPDGRTYYFKSKAAADFFKKRTGMK